jgi:hypothetical protein
MVLDGGQPLVAVGMQVDAEDTGRQDAVTQLELSQAMLQTAWSMMIWPLMRACCGFTVMENQIHRFPDGCGRFRDASSRGRQLSYSKPEATAFGGGRCEPARGRHDSGRKLEEGRCRPRRRAALPSRGHVSE